MKKRKTVKVVVAKGNVITLKQVAKRFAESLGLKRKDYFCTKNTIRFRIWNDHGLRLKQGLEREIDLGGWCWHCPFTKAEVKRDVLESDDNYSVDFARLLNVPDVVWAEDEDGNAVAIVN